MSRRRSPPRRPPGWGCSRRSSAQFAGKIHSSSCYCYYYHMAATSIPTLERRLRELLREQDRKSTRLNSSHGYISYAVFCLKKKNKSKSELLLHTTGNCADS